MKERTLSEKDDMGLSRTNCTLDLSIFERTQQSIERFGGCVCFTKFPGPLKNWDYDFCIREPRVAAIHAGLSAREARTLPHTEASRRLAESEGLMGREKAGCAKRACPV